MYKIYADDKLIYDSTLEDYKIGKGSITLEVNKSGSFTFSIYPDHFFYDSFVRLKTIITVYKSGRIVFRGRILNDVTDYWNNKVITCEGELGFLQDSIIRPFSFTGTPEKLFKQFIAEHNAQVDEFKRFKIGTITVEDPNDYIARDNSNYESALSNLNNRLVDGSLGGYVYITHGEDGKDPIPTINYLADFTKVSSQKIEFGSNLKNYTKTVKAEDIATAIIPLGHEVDDGDSNTPNPKLTISSVNDGRDYVYSEEGVALYGWIFKTVSWDDVTEPINLKAKAEDYLTSIIRQNVTIELNAIDLHLLDHSIESFNVGDYITVISIPHNFNSTLLCRKQTIDIVKPENDSITLGSTYSTFTESNAKVSSEIKILSRDVSAVNVNVKNIRSEVTQSKNEIKAEVTADVEELNKTIATLGTSLTLNTNKLSAIVSAIGDDGGEITAASIVASINESGSEVKISANHIDITGLVTVKSLETEGATNINGGNITSGTINGVTFLSTGDYDYQEVTITKGRIELFNGVISTDGLGGMYLDAKSILRFVAKDYVEVMSPTRFYVGDNYWTIGSDGIHLYDSNNTLIKSIT